MSMNCAINELASINLNHLVLPKSISEKIDGGILEITKQDAIDIVWTMMKHLEDGRLFTQDCLWHSETDLNKGKVSMQHIWHFKSMINALELLIEWANNDDTPTQTLVFS